MIFNLQAENNLHLQAQDDFQKQYALNSHGIIF